MAKRDIGTRLTLDGEAEFKSAVDNINMELKVLASEMGAATSSFDKNNASVADLKNQNAIYQKQLEAQRAKQAEYNKMLEEARAAQSKAAAAVAEASDKFGAQSKEVKKAEEQLAAVNKKLDDYQIGANYAAKAVNKLEAAQKANNEQIDKMNKADFGKFKDGLVNASKAAAAAVTAVATAAAGVVTAVTAAANETAAYGDTIDKSSQKLGVSAEFYQEWEAVLQHSGTSMDAMGASFKKLATASQNASKKQVAAFEALGLSMDQVSSMSAEELFESVVSGLQGMEESTERTAIATTLLGKGAQELGPLFNTSAEDTQAMIDAVNDLGGVMSNESVKASAAYQDAMQDMQTAMEGAKRNLVSQFLPSMTTVMGGLTSLFTGDKGGLAAINSGISDMVSKITAMLPDVLTSAVQIAEGLIGAITDNLPALAETATTIIVSLADGIISNLPVMADAAIQMILTLSNGLANSLPELVPTIVDVVLNIVDILISNVNLLIDAAVAIIEGLAEGIINSLPILLEKMPEIVGKIVSAIIQAIPQLIDCMVTVMTELTASVAQNIPLIKDAVAGMMVECGLAIKNKAGEWISAFEDIGGKVYDWTQSLKTSLKNAFDGIIENLTEALTPVFDIGVNIINGIINGITEGVKNIKGKINNACEAILDGVKGFFGIASPSKLFKNEVGVYLAQGLGEGFTSQMSKVSKAMVQAVPTDFGNVNIGVKAGGSGYGGGNYGGNGGAGQGGNIVFNQYNTSPKALSAAEINKNTRQSLQLAYCMR